MMPLVELLVPSKVIEFIELIQNWSEVRAIAEQEQSILGLDDFPGTRIDEPCPPDMVDMGGYCIDRFPWPNNEFDEPLLGTSAIRESYLKTGSKTWDCESLCESAGKRVCTALEWQEACEGTPEDECGRERSWIRPDWAKVMRRDPAEMAKLDQHPRAEHYPDCQSTSGVYMMTTLEEWVSIGEGYALTRGFWSREGGCKSLNRAHAPNWHGYATACRCCMDPEP